MASTTVKDGLYYCLKDDELLAIGEDGYYRCSVCDSTWPVKETAADSAVTYAPGRKSP